MKCGPSIVRAKPRVELDAADPRIKKADVAKHLEVFHHIGLLANELPGTTKRSFI
jgi:hypothetical protein